eukprot:3685253-Amphidinium_carterae.2
MGGSSFRDLVARHSLRTIAGKPRVKNGLLFGKRQGTVPPELVKGRAGAVASSAPALEDEKHQVVDGDQES